MNFLYPAFLLGALAIAVPLVLHLLRRDVAPEVRFSAVRLLRQSPIEQSRRRRLRDLLLLAARVVALLLLAAAFARPYVAGGAATAGLHVIAIDRSFSMDAPGRFARAQELARAAVREAGMKDRIAVIAFDDRADVVAQVGTRGDAQTAIDALAAGYGSTRYAPVIAKAMEIARGAPARLVIISDLQRTGWEDEQPVTLPAALQVDVRDVGELPPNLAVAAVRVEQGRAVATLRNSGPARASVVKGAIDGAPASESRFRADAAETVDVALPLGTMKGVLTVSVADAGGIPGDDSRHVILDPPARRRVLLVTGGGNSGFYLSRALAVAAVDEDGFDTKLVDGKALASMPADDVSRHAAIVLLSTRGLDRRGRDAISAFVRRGGGLLVVAADDLEPSVLTAMLGWQPPLAAAEQPGNRAALSPTDLRHPIFRPFGVLAANLGQVQFARAWRVEEDGWEVAARFSNGAPALLERRAAEGRVVLFASDLDRRWNDFPLHPAFVPFAVESVRYLAATRERPREYVVSQAPSGVRPVPGPIRVPPDNHPAVLNVDTRESNTTRITTAEFNQMLARVEQAPSALAAARAEQDEARQSYWQYGLLLMLAVLVVESFVGRV